MNWAGLVKRIGERRGVYRILVGNMSVREHLEDLDLDDGIIMR
jgi:hypothetical protein